MQGSGATEQVLPVPAEPEQLAQLTSLDVKEVITMLQTLKGRKQLLQTIKSEHPDVDLKGAERQIEQMATVLESFKKYQVTNEKEEKAAEKAPEKKSLFWRAIDVITYLPRKHPIVTAVLAIALAVYFGGWFPKKFGLGSWGWGGGEAAAAGAAAEGATAAGEAARAAGAAAEGVTAAAGAEAVTAAAEEVLAMPKFLLEGREIIYDGIRYSKDNIAALEKVLPDIVNSVKGNDGYISIYQKASSRESTQRLLRELLEKAGAVSDDLFWKDSPVDMLPGTN